MAKLIYTVVTSLDGYIEDESGSFDWAEPDPEVHAFINDLERPVGTYLYGRRMYEMMAVWETVGVDGVGTSPGEPASPEEVDFADVWRAADKVVYSTTLDDVTTSRTRLEREFDPDAVRRLRDGADDDLNVSGPDLARHAFAAGLVDEINLFLLPIIVGGGKPGLPNGPRLSLGLSEERRFANGTTYARYQQR